MNAKIIFGIFVIASLLASAFLVAATITKQIPVKPISSIQVDDSKKVLDSEESAQLIPLAKITEEEAKNIALRAVDIQKVGKITDVEIENEDGSVMYAVEFTKNSIETDVKIDAGNGKVLLIEDDNNEQDSSDDESD